MMCSSAVPVRYHAVAVHVDCVSDSVTSGRVVVAEHAAAL